MGVRCRRSTQSYISIPDVAGLRLSEFAIEVCGVRFEDLPGSGEHYPFVTKGELDQASGGDANYWFGLWNDGGTYKLRVGYIGSAADQEYASAFTPTVGRWYSFLATFKASGGELRIYEEQRRTPGDPTEASAYTEVGSGSTGHPAITTSTQPVYIGASDDASASAVGEVANATISEVRLYSAEKLPATQDALLTTRLKGNETDLVGLWRLDDWQGQTDGGGSTAYDRQRGGGNDGSFVSRPQWSDDPLDLYHEAGLIGSGLGFVGWHSGTTRPQAVITASEEDSDYLDNNLRSPSQAYVWRTTDATGAKTVVVDFGQPVAIWALTVDNHNLDSGATINAQLHTADSWGAPSVDEHVTFHPSILRHCFARPQKYRYARISITDAAAAGAYIQLGTLHWWVCWPFHEGADADSYPLHDPSTAVRARHGWRTARAQSVRPDLTIDWTSLRRGPGYELRRILQSVGGGAPVWVCPNAKRELYRGVYGYVTALPQEQLGDPSWVTTAWGGLGVEADRP
jgi:hypothetical protein